MAEKLEALVEFDYKAQEPDELTIRKGDVIYDINQQPGGWWEGTLGSSAKRGMFPDNFVKVFQINDNKMDIPRKQGVAKHCRVLFGYQPANEDELELHVGDCIEILNEVEEGWWRGKLNSQIGVFPSNFVEEVFDVVLEAKEASQRRNPKNFDSELSKLPSAPSPTTMNHTDPPTAEPQVPELPPKPVKEFCLVMYPYDAVNDDELTLREGDVITLASKDCQDKGWWRGELNGRLGVFPDNFVQLITTEELNKPARPPSKINTTTNRVKDSITRPTTPQTTAQRKSLEIPPKQEEKTSPPEVSKKPLLPPPPLKKPQRSPSGSSVSKTLVTTPPTVLTTSQTSLSHLVMPPSILATSPTILATSPPKLAISPTNLSIAQPPTNKLSESPSNTTANKLPLLSPKQSMTDPPKTPPDTADGGIMSRNVVPASFSTDNDFDCVGRSNIILTHPTASRARPPRRRPRTGVPTSEPEETSPKLVNGTEEHHFTVPEDTIMKAPWVEELKMNQAKKNSALGRTRVTIGSDEPPGSVQLRSTTRPQSMITSRSFSLSPSSPDSFTISYKQWTQLNDKVQRLEEMLNTQQKTFTQTVNELRVRLNEEIERTTKVETELAKLANFVTQV